MIKKTITLAIILTVLLVLNTFSINTISEEVPIQNHIKTSSITEKYNIENITLKDDAYHPTNRIFRPEWWYFDSSLNDEYIVHIGCIILIHGKLGIVSPGIYIYQNNILKYGKRLFRSMRLFDISDEKPLIQMQGTQIMNGYIDNDTGKWIYDLHFEFGEYGAYLKFTGLNEGFKTTAIGGKWAVILPQAEVTGTIKIDNEIIQVNGTGYHDHNWDTKIPLYELGHYWGKIQTNTTNLIFAKIRTFFKNEYFSVLNFESESNILIRSDCINFKILEYEEEGLRKTIKKANLLIEDTDLFVNFTMETLGLHYAGFLRHFYCRYIVRITGELTYNGKTEIINTINLMEETRLR